MSRISRRPTREDIDHQSSTPTPQRNGTQRQENERDETNDGDLIANTQGIPNADIQVMVKNFVRLALASEHTRTPIKREDVSKKVFINDHKRCFKLVFEHTQARLIKTLGMKLVALPAKDRTKNMTMTQQRKAAHHQASAGATPNASKSNELYVLQNILPPKLKQISQRQHMDSERNYNAVLMIVLLIVVMSDDQTCSENRVLSAMDRLGWAPTTPAGPFDEVIAKMTKQLYLERVRDDQSVDGTYSLFVGPRGKLETLRNRDDLFELIATVYGHASDDGQEARDRLKQIIDNTFDGDEEFAESDEDGQNGDESMQWTQTQTQTPRQPESAPRVKRAKTDRRRTRVHEDEDDD